MNKSIYIYACYPPGYPPFLGLFAGNDRSGPLPGPPKIPKGHTYSRSCCIQIINYKGTLVFERSTTYATTLPQRPKIGKVGVALLHPKYTL